MAPASYMLETVQKKHNGGPEDTHYKDILLTKIQYWIWRILNTVYTRQD